MFCCWTNRHRHEKYLNRFSCCDTSTEPGLFRAKVKKAKTRSLNPLIQKVVKVWKFRFSLSLSRAIRLQSSLFSYFAEFDIDRLIWCVENSGRNKCGWLIASRCRIVYRSKMNSEKPAEKQTQFHTNENCFRKENNKDFSPSRSWPPWAPVNDSRDSVRLQLILIN